MNDYSSFAAVYDGYFAHFDNEGYYRYLLNLCGRSSIAGAHVLDLGCGTGSLLLKFARDGAEVTGVDLSREMLSRADAKFYAAGKKADLRLADIAEYRDGRKYDIILCCCDTVNYLDGERAGRCFDSVAQMLAPDGVFIFDVINSECMPSEREVHFTPEGVKLEFSRHMVGDRLLTEITFDGEGLSRAEEHVQYVYSGSFYSRALREAGLKEKSVQAFFSAEAPDEKSEKTVIVAVKR